MQIGFRKARKYIIRFTTWVFKSHISILYDFSANENVFIILNDISMLIFIFAIAGIILSRKHSMI